jgi:hypothetical protein
MGSDLVYSILVPEWNADKTRVDKFVIDRRTPVPSGIDLQVGVYEEANLWRRLDLS